MNVALYYPWLYLKSGGERTIAAILAHSRHRWTIFTNRYEPESTFPELAHARIIELPRVSVTRSIDHVVSAAYTIARQRLPLTDEQLLLVVCEGLGDFVTFRNRRVPIACLCLTPLRAAFDPHYQAGTVNMRGGGRARRAVFAALSAAFRTIDRIAWRNYSAVFAISREVEGRIRRGRLAPGLGGVEVLYPGVDTARLTPGWQYQRYFLLPGRIMWTKNIELALEAFASVRAHLDEAETRLVIAGFVDEKSKPYLDRLRERANQIGGISFVESPSDAELYALYRSCWAVLVTAFNEDWGLTPLEAMAVGKPVIAVDRGGPKETVRDGETGFLVASDPTSFAAAMQQLSASPELTRRMGEAGRLRAERFDTRLFVAQLDDRLQAMADVDGPRRATATADPHAGPAFTT